MSDYNLVKQWLLMHPTALFREATIGCFLANEPEFSASDTVETVRNDIIESMGNFLEDGLDYSDNRDPFKNLDDVPVNIRTRYDNLSLDEKDYILYDVLKTAVENGYVDHEIETYLPSVQNGGGQVWYYYQTGPHGGEEYLDMVFDNVEDALEEAKRQLDDALQTGEYDDVTIETLKQPKFTVRNNVYYWDYSDNGIYRLPKDISDKDIILLSNLEGETQYVVSEKYHQKRRK